METSESNPTNKPLLSSANLLTETEAINDELISKLNQNPNEPSNFSFRKISDFANSKINNNNKNNKKRISNLKSSFTGKHSAIRNSNNKNVFISREAAIKSPRNNNHNNIIKESIKDEF